MTIHELFSKLPKPDRNSKIKLLTHTDMDGSGASIVLRSIFDDVEIKHCSNAVMSEEIKNAILDEESNFDWIFACDISCNETDAEIINNHPNSKKLILLDHHITAMSLNKYDWACVEPKLIKDSYRAKLYTTPDTGLSSGTSLVYDFMEYCDLTRYISDIDFLKTIVHMIAAYDTWDWVNHFGKNPDFDTLSTLFDIYMSDRFEEKILNKINTPKTDSTKELFDDIDRLLLDIEHDKIDIYLKGIEKAFTTGTIKIQNVDYSIVFCTSDKYLQETFEHMKAILPDYDIYLINYGNGIGLRATKDEINVGMIAKEFGGGGHPGAAGVKIPFAYQVDIIEKTFSANITIDEKE